MYHCIHFHSQAYASPIPPPHFNTTGTLHNNSTTTPTHGLDPGKTIGGSATKGGVQQRSPVHRLCGRVGLPWVVVRRWCGFVLGGGLICWKRFCWRTDSSMWTSQGDVRTQKSGCSLVGRELLCGTGVALVVKLEEMRWGMGQGQREMGDQWGTNLE